MYLLAMQDLMSYDTVGFIPISHLVMFNLESSIRVCYIMRSNGIMRRVQTKQPDMSQYTGHNIRRAMEQDN